MDVELKLNGMVKVKRINSDEYKGPHFLPVNSEVKEVYVQDSSMGVYVVQIIHVNYIDLLLQRRELRVTIFIFHYLSISLLSSI